MPRNKKGSSRGRSRARGGSSRGGGGGVEGYSRNIVSDDDDMDYVPFAGRGRNGIEARNNHLNSLQHEALNTQRHHNWNPDSRLRNAKVDFISAGDLQPSEPIQIEAEAAAALADMSLEVSVLAGNSTKPSSVHQDPPADTEEELYEPFVIDTVGTSQSIVTGLPPPQVRSPSPTPSNSSDEVILFGGRDSSGRGLRRKTPAKAAHLDPYAAKIKVIDDKIQADEQLLAAIQLDNHEQNVPSTGVMMGNPKKNASSVSRSEYRELLQGSPDPRNTNETRIEMVIVEVEKSRDSSREHSQSGKKRCSNQGIGAREASRLRDSTGAHALQRMDRQSKTSERHSYQQTKEDEEQALIDDYIANMEEDEMDHNGTYSHRTLGLEEVDVWVETDTSATENLPRSKLEDWDRQDIDDFDDLNTSDGLIGAVEVILSRRQRPSGLQYLVVWEETSVDEARWILDANLSDARARTLIDEFEAEERLVAEFLDDENGDSDSDEASDDSDAGGEGFDDSDDESDLVQRAKERMTDEKIARLLAKQEELGMGSDELLLFDDEADVDAEPHLDVYLTQKRGKNRRGIRGPNQATGHFPAASALADAYDGFDVMDFERPSIAAPKKPKGRKGKLILDSDIDSEMEDSMQMAWENDRLKKKERKGEREELRAAGMLGKKKTGKPDLDAKYREGMGILAVKDEIRSFLMGDNTTLSLPPMDKADRKVVHEIANAFNLKSKSAGLGKKRFPVLYRTSRTVAYKEHIFNAVEGRITRRFLPRMDVKGKKPTRASGGGRGGFGATGVSYRDGDVVGASAPELGVENKGRKMLELMGWSSGTALGALNNKGILQPVSHVVKTTKAGLG